jgi:hypothetical protein
MTLVLGLLALAVATAPARAEQYIVEPIVDTIATPAGTEQGFTQAELDQMLAPVALYPDALLSQVLIAATYPLEVVEAARWSRQNSQLSGEDAVMAVADREWDPSVKSLVAFPDLLARMDEDLDWTRNIGDAMLFQESQVMDSIQFLRARADAAGNLDNTEYVKVIREEKTIVIQPAQTRIVHVPYYDPHVVYGTWWWPAYRPVVWAPPSYYYAAYPGFYWGTGIRISAGFFYSDFYWPHRSVMIVHAPRYYTPRYRPSRPYYVPGQRWKHNPIHRRGVNYRHPEVRERYSRYGSAAGPAARWSGTQRPSRGDLDRTRDGRGDEGRGSARGGSDADRRQATAGNRPRLPEDRVRDERRDAQAGGTRVQNRYDNTEARRGGSTSAPPRSGVAADESRRAPANSLATRGAVRDERPSRPDAASLARRIGASGDGQRNSGHQPAARSERPVAVAPSRSTQAARGQVTQRSTTTVRTPAPQATQRSTVPTRTPQATQRSAAPTRTPQATQRSTVPTRTPQATQRSAAPTRTPQATRPQASQRSAAPAPRVQPRSAPAPTAAPAPAPAQQSRAPSRAQRDSGSRSRSDSSRDSRRER